MKRRRATLPHPLECSTIAAPGLSYRVRNGTGRLTLSLIHISLAKVEDFKRALTEHNAWDLPFMGYVNEDGYGYAYVPDAAITMNPVSYTHLRQPGRVAGA